MADQHDIADVLLGQQLRKLDECRFVHVLRRTRMGQRLGEAVPSARIDERSQTGSLGQRRGEASPQRDRTKALVKKDEFRRVGARGRDPFGLDARHAR